MSNIVDNVVFLVEEAHTGMKIEVPLEDLAEVLTEYNMLYLLNEVSTSSGRLKLIIGD